MKKLVRGLAMILAAVLCLGLYACGLKTQEQQPETQTPTTVTEPATWPDGGTILPPPGEFETEPGYEAGTAAPDENETEPAAGSPAGSSSFPAPVVLKGEANSTAGTLTGLLPLPPREIAIADPNNSKNLPTKKIEHAYGASKNGVPHQISIDNQSFFTSKDYAAVAYDNVTKDVKPIYLTFDCGYENGNTAKILDVLKEKNVKAAFFCTVDEMKLAPDVVARMINEGHIVGNHSLTHPSFAAIDRAAMAKEVLEGDNYLRTSFGYSAPFFRFPKGEYTESALEAVASMGFTSVFWSASYADWDVNAQKGAQYAADTVLSRLHPGAIVLLHSVSKDNADAMARIIDGARAQGYVFRELTELPQFHS
jgi:peptidoglycan-N-acetylmuramic acid deacetylase